MATATGYSRTQIVLHWAVATLVAQQFLLKGAIVTAWDMFTTTGVSQFSPLVAAHVFGGILILVLVLVRLAAHAKRGAPELSKDEHPALKIVARATHAALYLLLVLLAVSGLLTWFGGVEQAASAHKVLKTALLVLIALHVFGALFQRFYLKSDSLRRMLEAV